MKETPVLAAVATLANCAPRASPPPAWRTPHNEGHQTFRCRFGAPCRGIFFTAGRGLKLGATADICPFRRLQSLLRLLRRARHHSYTLRQASKPAPVAAGHRQAGAR